MADVPFLQAKGYIIAFLREFLNGLGLGRRAM